MEGGKMAERKRLKKYRMAVGICGPTVLYTNIIRAYSAEEAARKYLSEDEDGTVPEEKVREIADRMYEIEDGKPVSSYLDARGETLEPGDSVYALVKANGRTFSIVEGVVSKLTKRGIKVQADDAEYLVPVGTKDAASRWKDPFFSRAVRITEEMKSLGAPEIGSEVAYIDGAFMSSSKVFSFGTVTKITASNIYINGEDGEARRTPDRVRRIR